MASLVPEVFDTKSRTETPFNPIDGIWIIAQRMGAPVEHFRVKYI